MGVVRCRDDAGSVFHVVVIPKAGSTSLRIALAPWAQGGQYRVKNDGSGVEKHRSWTLGSPYRGEPRATAVLRNPWARLASRWHEKVSRGDTDMPFDEWASCQGASTVHSRPQARFLRAEPDHVVSWEHDDVWAHIRSAYGIDVRPTRRRTSGRNWRDAYRTHPDARDIVRETQGPDFELGFTWEDPLCAP